MISRELAIYETWSDFKNELQRRSGNILLNKLWLQVKPREPLPWYEHQMKEAVEQLAASHIGKSPVVVG
jgi:hypothetical protein